MGQTPATHADAGEVLLELSFTVRPEQAHEFDRWLRDHLADVLQLPGLLSADLAEVVDMPGARTALLRLKRREDLDAWLTGAPGGVLAAAKARFGEAVSGSSRLLRPQEQLVHGAVTENCPNCSELLTGQYCAVCGQRASVRLVSTWELLTQLVGDLVNADARVWRTLRTLLLEPGLLTTEYLSGRQKRFTPPFRLFLFVTAAGFLVSSLRPVPEFLVPPPAPDAAAQGPTNAAAKPTEHPDAQVRDGFRALSDLCSEKRAEGHGRAVRSLSAACRKALGEQSVFIKAVRANMSRDMFIVLPLLALVAYFLHAHRRRYYVEHLLFFVHVICFATLVDIVADLPHVLRLVDQPWPLLHTAAVSLVVGTYTFRAMRKVYGDGRWMTLFKLAVIGAWLQAFSLVLGLLMLVFTMLTL